jgi:hypothetical protein
MQNETSWSPSSKESTASARIKTGETGRIGGCSICRGNLGMVVRLAPSGAADTTRAAEAVGEQGEEVRIQPITGT